MSARAFVEARAPWIAAAIVVSYFLVQIAGLTSIGLTDDDDFYIPAGTSYVTWLKNALTLRDGAWTRSAIDAAFEPNHEHPPFAKYVFGVCRWVFGFLGPADGARVGTTLFSTSIAALLLWLALAHLGRARGLGAGGMGVLFLLALPRFYFHSHAATLDVPVAAMVLLTTSVALFGERSTRAAILAGPIFGLAMATKLNAPFLLLGYLPYVWLTRRRASDSPARSAPHVMRLPAIPLACLSMIVVGPLVFVAAWPWLWFDLVERLAGYVGFHLNHYGIHFLYFGEVYTSDPFAPWHAPLVMAASTTPLVTSALAVAGVGFAVPAIALRLRFLEGPDDDRRREGDLLLSIVLQAFVAIGVVVFSAGAKYGGEKLFMPFFPFWCFLAGYGSLRLYEVLSASWKTRAAPIGVLGFACASLVSLQVKFGAYALSEYNALLGGLRGATAFGFERQYYDVAFRDLVAWLNAEAPPKLRVHFLPNNWEYVRTYKWYKLEGELRGDIEVAPSESQADWIVLTHERRFSRYGEDLMRYRNRPVLRERILDGTPIWSVLRVR